MRLTLSVSVAGVVPVAPGGTLALDVTWSGADTQRNFTGVWVFVSEADANHITINGVAWQGIFAYDPFDPLNPAYPARIDFPLTPPANGGVWVNLPHQESGTATFAFENVGVYYHPKSAAAANYVIVVEPTLGPPITLIDSAVVSFNVAGEQHTRSFVQQPVSGPVGPLATVKVQELNDLPGPDVGDWLRLTLNSTNGAQLSGTRVVPTDSQGIATFDNLSIDKPGQGYTLTVTSPNYPGTVTSAPFDVLGGALSFTQQPVSGPVGKLAAVTVQILDMHGQPLENTDVTVALGNPNGAVLSGFLTAQTDSQGIATFDNLSINQPGQGYFLTASATGASSVDSQPFDLGHVDVQLVPSVNRASPGASISYTVAATSTIVAKSFVVTSAIPDWTDLIPGSLTAGGALSGSTITWNLPGGTQASAQYAVKVRPRADLPPTLTGIAAAAHVDAVFANATFARDTASEIPLVRGLDLQIAAFKQQIAPLDTLAYTITATPQARAESFLIWTEVPEGTDLVSASKGAKISTPVKGTKRITWKLRGGAIAQVQFTVKVRKIEDLPGGVSKIHAFVHAEAVIGGATDTCEESRDTPLVRPDFDWSMPDRYGIDSNNNHLIDLPNSHEYVNPTSGFHVILDASGIVSPLPFTQYQWKVTGNGLNKTFSGQTVEIDHLRNEKTYNVKLTATAGDGSTARVTKKVAVRDVLIAAIGDSYSSGEGNPELAGTPGRWADGVTPAMDAENFEAHRSTQAASSQAALAIEAADKHYSVTFVMLSESGSTIKEGLLGPKEGCENPVIQVPAQVPKLKKIIGNRKIDILTVSIGGNDIGFSGIIKELLIPVPGVFELPYLSWVESGITPELQALQGEYLRLGRIIRSTLAPRHVIQTEYPDPTRDGNKATVDFAADILPGFSISASRAAWARTHVIEPLNQLVWTSLNRNGWEYGGALTEFATHGYAADDHWFVTMTESKARQGIQQQPVNLSVPVQFDASGAPSVWASFGIDVSLGALHPNAEGHATIADSIFTVLKPDVDKLPKMPNP